METNHLPVAIIGAGPIGLAAAAHLLRKGETPLIFEAGPSVGAAVLQWRHVRLFSPWHYLLDREAAALLAADGWLAPDPEAYPTGRELVEDYLAPLANTPLMKPHLRLDTRVVAVTRQGVDKMKTPGREQAAFVLRLRAVSGEEQDVLHHYELAFWLCAGAFLLAATGIAIVPQPGERHAASMQARAVTDEDMVESRG